jgi:hypothetical protein
MSFCVAGGKRVRSRTHPREHLTGVSIKTAKQREMGRCRLGPCRLLDIPTDIKLWHWGEKLWGPSKASECSTRSSFNPGGLGPRSGFISLVS